MSAHAVLRELVAARDARAPERVAALLGPGVRYWDCETDELTGRDAVANALLRAGSVSVETLAAEGDDAVLELQLVEGDRRYRSTEVCRVVDGLVASIRAYHDPDARNSPSSRLTSRPGGAVSVAAPPSSAARYGER